MNYTDSKAQLFEMAEQTAVFYKGVGQSKPKL
jgi:hypothetical protein